MRKTIKRRSVLALAIVASFSNVAAAQNGSWNVDASGNWTDTANWAGGIAANGSGSTATFANDITGVRTVTINSVRTLTHLVFGDADTSTAGGWKFSGSSGISLTGTTPTVTVNALGAGQVVELSSFGTSTSWTKAGPGLLKLTGIPSLSGITTISAGTLQFGNDNASTSAGGRSFAGSGTLMFTGMNTGAPTGTVSSTSLSGTSTSFSGTMVADNMRLQINSAASAGTATLVNSGNGQFHFGSGTYSNNFVIQGIGWGGTEGNTGAIRLASSLATTLTGQITLAADARITNTGSTSIYSVLAGPIGETGGARTLEIGGGTAGSTISLAGANTYTGGTLINGGMYDGISQPILTSLRLDYATQNNSKLPDSGVLRFKGISSLTLTNGSHAELVGLTTLDPGANALIDRFGSATLNLGALTRNAAATLTVGQTAFVTTTSGPVGEAFGSWFVVGADLATKNGSNQIVPVTYTDVPTVTGTIVDGPASSVRLTTTTSGTVALGGLAGDTITINTLSRHVSGIVTVNTAGKTLRIRNGILSVNGSGGITVGTSADPGILTAGTTDNTAGNLEISNGASGNQIIYSKIADNGTGPVTLTKLSQNGLSADLILMGANTYSGGTILNGPGSVRLGNSSSLGTGPVTLLNSATLNGGFPNTPPITLANNFDINNGSTLSFFLSNASFTMNGVLSGTAGKLSVSTGSANNSLTLTNSNTFTGSTLVLSGKLLLSNGGNLASSTVSVSNNATLGISQNASNTTNSTAGALTLAAGANFSMADGYTSTFSVGTTAAFTSGTNSTLSFDLGGTTTTADRLAITGAVTGTGGTTISINPIGTIAPTIASFPIITAASGLNTANLTLAKTKAAYNGTAYQISLTKTATAATVNVTGLTGLDAVYWKGDQNGAWNANNSGNTNWALAADGVTDAGALPNALTDVYFNANGAANLTTTLGVDTTIYSLNYAAASSATTLAAGNTLTIGAPGSNSPGINVANGSAAQTINAPISLGTAQSWTNNGTNTLTVGGAVDNNGFGLTFAGTGPTTVSGAVSGSGTLTFNTAGNVLLSGDISGGGAIAATGTGSATISGNISGTSSITKSGTGTLTLSGTNSYTGATTLSAGTLKVGSSAGLGAAGQTLTLSGGTLHLASDTPVSTKNLTFPNDMTITLDRATTGAGLTTTFGDFLSNSTLTVNNGANVTSGTSTLAFNGTLNIAGADFAVGAGAAVNLSGNTPAASQNISLTKTGAGTLIISGNTESWNSGFMTLNGGTLELRTRIGDNTAFAAPISAAHGTTVRLVADADTSFISNLSASNGNITVVADRLAEAATSTTHSLGNLSLSSQMLTIARGSNITGAGVAGVTFNENINSTTGTTALSFNTRFNTEANTLLTIKGVASGNGSLTKQGPGAMTLVAANTYTGGTLVNGGTLNLAFGTTTSNILLSTGALTLGGGMLNLTGTGTQTVAGLTTSLATSSGITLADNQTLTLGALTSAGAGSTLNVNTASGGANASTNTIGTSIVTLTGQTPGKSINIGYTVTDAGGTGFATVNASNQVVRMSSAISTLLPPTAADVATDYLINNNAGGTAAAGSSSLTVTTTQSARTISVDTTAASGIMKLNSGTVLSNNGWLFTGNNPYKISGSGTLKAAASGNAITFNNMNTAPVTIESAIVANGKNAVGFTGTGTTILTGTNTYTGDTGIASGVLQIGAGTTLDGTATSGEIGNLSTITIAAGAKLIYNRAGQKNSLAGAGAVEFYGNNNGSTGGGSVILSTGSSGFSGTMLISGIIVDASSNSNVGSAEITVLPTGRFDSGYSTYSNNFTISGIGYGTLGGYSRGVLYLDGSTLNGTITLAGDARISGYPTVLGNTINGVIGETGGARKLQIGGNLSDSSTVTLNAANTYTGGTDLGSTGSDVTTVNVGNDLAFNTGPVNVLSDGVVASSGGARTLANPFTVASGKTLTFDGTEGLLTVNSALSTTGFSGGIAVSGGTVLLNGMKNYTGSTTVTAGTLQISGSVNAGNLNVGSSDAGVFTVLNGASYTTTGGVSIGNGTANNTLNINAGGSLSTKQLNVYSQATYNIDGNLNVTTGWYIRTNATSNINGSVTGSISTPFFTTLNPNSVVNFNSLGTTSITGNLNLAATTSGAVNINAGTLNVAGVTWGGAAQTFNLNGGRFNVGPSGIASTGGSSRTINLGNAIVGSSADWSSSQSMVLTGTGSGTTFNTLDAVDNSTARTITLAGSLSGAGKLNKAGAGTLILSGANTYSGGTAIVAGTLLVGPGGSVGAGTVTNNATFEIAGAGITTGVIAGTGTTSVIASDATLTANLIRQVTLNIGAGNSVTIAANGGDSGTSRVTNLSINPTGKLDLMNNDLIIDNGNLAAVMALLASGLDINGTYGNGPGITSSMFANDPNFNTVLGIAANVELGYTSFSGQAVDANDVLIKYTYFGDSDLNGVVDTATDFDLYITGLTSGGSLGGWLYGDFDYNGTVDSATDFDLYITGLTSQGSPLRTVGGGGGNLVQAVPEPSTWVMGCLGLTGLAAWRLRKRRLSSEDVNC